MALQFTKQLVHKKRIKPIVSSLEERRPMLGKSHNEIRYLADAVADNTKARLVEAGKRKGSKPFQILLAYTRVLLEERK